MDTVSEMQKRYLSAAKFDVKKESLVLSTPEDIKLQYDVDSVVEALFAVGVQFCDGNKRRCSKSWSFIYILDGN